MISSNAGANLEAEDTNGDRAIHNAAKNGNLEVVIFLREVGADIDSKGMYGGNIAIIKVG